ncbi:MAG: tryptophan--tRNA ligase [Patescibacteria group bacterium]
MNTKKERVLSGVQPSGKLHIGNYLGAIKQFVALQDEYEAYYCVVDEHAITVPQEPKELHANTLAIAMAYLAAGIDPKKSVIFVQSHVPAHTELGWILNTMTPLGDLERMTQFKDKGKIKYSDVFKDTSALVASKIKDELYYKVTDVTNLILREDHINEQRKSILAGLFNYPTLMAADILLYQASAVPVGEDQVQHIELTRSLAERFNNRFGDTFIIPKVLLQKTSARIMALDEPTKKMSKSAASEASYIALSDTPDQIRKKIKTATTDSGKEIRYDPQTKPGISNLLGIVAEFSNKTIKKLEKEFSNSSYAQFKEMVAEYIVIGLQSFQTRYKELEKNQDEVIKILHNGKQKAEVVANGTLGDVKEKMGFLL